MFCTTVMVKLSEMQEDADAFVVWNDEALFTRDTVLGTGSTVLIFEAIVLRSPADIFGY